MARHQAEWAQLERMLRSGAIADGGTGDHGATGKVTAAAPELPATFPALYRRVCRHLALATERRYPQDIVERLNALALAGQQVLYRPETRLWPTIAAFLAGGFAARVRRNARVFWLAMALFYLPFIGCALATWHSPHLVYSLMEPAQVERCAFMIVAYGSSRGDVGYVLRVRDFLNLKELSK